MTETRRTDAVLEVALDPCIAQGEERGVVVKWRRSEHGWEGLVSRVVGGEIRTEWVSTAVLRAVIDADGSPPDIEAVALEVHRRQEEEVQRRLRRPKPR